MSAYTPFWMVYGIGQGGPTVRHKTRESAIAEAKRLARCNAEVGFVVLEATHHIIKRDVDVTPIDPDFAEVEPRRMADSDIPF